MSKKKKEEKATLPPSGLAEDILQLLEAEAAVQDEGADRIYTFADSVQPVEEEEAEKQVVLEKWVLFVLENEWFALPVTHVREVLRVAAITRVPHAPAPVRGITNLRGRVLPVVDLRRRIGLRESGVTEQSRILVAETRNRLIGLLVDAVRNVLSLDPSRIDPPPADVMTVSSDYILGVTSYEERLVILLDAEKIFLIQGELD